MQSQHIRKRRWQIVHTDLFNVKKDVYLVVVDNLTKYWDLVQLNDTDAESTILQMKKIFLHVSWSSERTKGVTRGGYSSRLKGDKRGGSCS